jgi:hypothetical protein
MKPADAFRQRVHQTLDAAAGQTPDLVPGITSRLKRRSPGGMLIALAQVVSLGLLAVLAAVVVLSMHRSHAPTAPFSAATPPSVSTDPAASVAWIASQTPGNVFTGVDPAGHVVGRITAPIDMRSPDGAHLYALGSNRIEVFSAVDGHLEATIALPFTPEVEMIAADGHYAAVESAIPRQVGLVDLISRRLLASTPVSAASGVPLIVGSHAEHIYLVTGKITELSFDGRSLRAGRSAPSSFGCAGLPLVFGDLNSFGGLAFRVLPDDRTLVAFCPADGRVTWFDLLTLHKVGDLVNGQQNPFWVSPVFSASGTTLYLHEGGSGRLAVIDLLARRSASSAKIALAPNPLAWLERLFVTPAYAGGVPRTAALSPDGRWLYAVGIFEAPGGVSVIHLPDLQRKARWLPNLSFDSVWVSADGQTIYALSQSTNTVRLLHTDGSEYASVMLPPMANGFVVPTIP